MRGQRRIETVFAFVVLDPADETEGIPAANAGGMAIPLLGADEDRLESLRPVARQLARTMGRRIELVRFSEREHVEWIEP